MTRGDAIEEIIETLRGATIVGSNPGFDDRFLRKLVGPGGQQWNYRPTCIANLVEGYLWHRSPDLMAEQAPKGFRSDWLWKQVDVPAPTDGTRHEALADARHAMAVYDAVTGGPKGVLA